MGPSPGRGWIGLAAGDLEADAVDDDPVGFSVTQGEQSGRGEQQDHHNHGANLRHVARQGGHHVDDELGGALEIVLGLRLAAEPIV